LKRRDCRRHEANHRNMNAGAGSMHRPHRQPDLCPGVKTAHPLLTQRRT
jgi:hypothetical protein